LAYGYGNNHAHENPSPDTKAKLAATRNMSSSSEGSADQMEQTRLEEMENCGDQRNHWRAARELVAGLLKVTTENEDNQDDEADGTPQAIKKKCQSLKTISKRTYSIRNEESLATR
jgi:hypothetical protein